MLKERVKENTKYEQKKPAATFAHHEHTRSPGRRGRKTRATGPRGNGRIEAAEEAESERLEEASGANHAQVSEAACPESNGHERRPAMKSNEGSVAIL
jgi:hypothetical protein